MIAAGAEDTANENDLVDLTVRLVGAYVSNNAMPLTHLPTFIDDIYAALVGVSKGTQETMPASPRPKPAVNPKKSVTGDYIICLEDGKKFKTIKRHLMNKYGLTPDQYRERWGLAPSYPMVAPNYAANRSRLAKSMGLGRKRKAAGS
jgi:predicted transcriptional regulator